MCGSHKGANPHRYKKSPARGDRGREETAGRKRISRIYREKGPSHILMSPDSLEEFDGNEFRILFSPDKRKAYDYSRSCDLDFLMEIQKISPEEIPAFVSSFEKKLKERNWGAIYTADNQKRYVYLNAQQSDRIWQYLQLHEP